MAREGSRGSDLVILPWHAEAEEMWGDGRSASVIGEKFGVTKNTVIGLASRRNWPSGGISTRAEFDGYEYKGSTLFTRLDAAHAKFDRLMEELRRGPSLTVPFIESGERRLR